MSTDALPFHEHPAIAAAFRLMRQEPAPRDEIVRVLRAAFPRDPNLHRLDAMVDMVFDRVPMDWHGVTAEGLERLFVDHLRAFLAETCRDGDRVTVRQAAVSSRLDRSHDVLATFDGAPATLLMAVNAVANLIVSPRSRAAVVSSMRDEGIALLEWVAHYRVHGFDQLFVYTNDNIDGSERLLAVLADHGVVRLLVNDIAPPVPAQQRSVAHAVHLLRELRDYRWVAFVDADELMVLAAQYQHSIHRFLADAEAALGVGASCLCLHWKWFGSEKAFARTPGLLLERFQQAHRNTHVKSIVRLRDVFSMHQLHVPCLAAGCVAATSGFTPLQTLGPESPTDYRGGQLNHYWNKSFEEFALRRARGDGSQPSRPGFKDFDTFFTWGQAVRPDEPPPPDLVGRVKDEMRALLERPGVREAVAVVERRFTETLRDFDRRLGLREIYASHMAGTDQQ